MLLRDTLLAVLRDPLPPPTPVREVTRRMLADLSLAASRATVLLGIRRCGKSTLQGQLMRGRGHALYCNFEDTRLYGLGPDDYPTFLSVLDELAVPDQPVFLDEVQEAMEWQRLVRALLDRGRAVCVTGSNASLLGRELGTKLTGRHTSFEVFPFGYGEYLSFTGQERGAASSRAYVVAMTAIAP